jgi:hypothetical protein
MAMYVGLFLTALAVHDVIGAAPHDATKSLIPTASSRILGSWLRSREGQIMLVQFASLGAGENGGRFTVKKYHSEKTATADGWRHARIQLLPLNPSFEPIEIEAEEAGDIVIVGELSQTVQFPQS